MRFALGRETIQQRNLLQKPQRTALSRANLGQPFDWNLVIVGSWNLAILTPGGVARRMFDLPPQTPLEVQVPLDGVGPLRVIFEGIMVEPSRGRLVITPVSPAPSELQRCVVIARRVLEGLPETPVSAAGLNFRFAFDSAPDSVIEIGTSSLDDKLSDALLTTQAKKLTRTLSWENGQLNLEIEEREDASARILFNFHHGSSVAAELAAWFDRYDSMIRQSEVLLQTILDEVTENGYSD